MEPMIIEVHGVPHIPPHDRMIDQLKIHFLKRRNCGGDVLTVIYPTSTPGQAYVIFESAKVHGVLEHTHFLDVHNKFYPIRVKKAHLPEVDMQAEATLDLSIFPKREPVLDLIKFYDVTLTEHTPGHLQLKGSFLKLKLIRNQLIQFQKYEHHYSRSPSALHNGSSLGYDLEQSNWDPRFVSKPISRNMDKMDAVGQRQLLDSTPSSFSHSVSESGGSHMSHQSSLLYYIERHASSPVDAVDQKYEKQDRNVLSAHRRSFLVNGASSISANDSSSVNLSQHITPLYRDSSNGSTSHTADTTQYHTSYKDSASGGSLRRRPSFSGDIWPSSFHGSPSSSTGEMASFQVDTDIITFICLQQQKDIEAIEKDYGTEMTLKDDDGLMTVKFRGKNSEKAKECLLNIIKEISPSLRTQKINLLKYDQAEQKQILERIQHNQDKSVVIKHCGDVIKLVGSSSESFEMKQKLLGHKVDHPRGRTIERGSKLRRSSSLPTQYKTTHHACRTDPEHTASAAPKYSPSRYEEKPDEGKAPQIVRVHELTPDKNSQRTRSNSESRSKNRTTREKSVCQDLELTSSSHQGKKSPNWLVAKLFDSNFKKLDIKGHLRRKK